jgi:hypothetical protein
LFAGFLFVTGILYVLKTKRSRLALMGAASLLDGVRQARYSGQQDDSCGEQLGGAPQTDLKEYSFFGKNATWLK